MRTARKHCETAHLRGTIDKILYEKTPRKVFEAQTETVVRVVQEHVNAYPDLYKYVEYFYHSTTSEYTHNLARAASEGLNYGLQQSAREFGNSDPANLVTPHCEVSRFVEHYTHIYLHREELNVALAFTELPQELPEATGKKLSKVATDLLDKIEREGIPYLSETNLMNPQVEQYRYPEADIISETETDSINASVKAGGSNGNDSPNGSVNEREISDGPDRSILVTPVSVPSLKVPPKKAHPPSKNSSNNSEQSEQVVSLEDNAFSTSQPVYTPFIGVPSVPPNEPKPSADCFVLVIVLMPVYYTGSPLYRGLEQWLQGDFRHLLEPDLLEPVILLHGAELDETQREN